MYGRYVPVRAEIVSATDFSVHADADELLAWVASAEQPPGGGLRGARSRSALFRAQPIGYTMRVCQWLGSAPLSGPMRYSSHITVGGVIPLSSNQAVSSS